MAAEKQRHWFLTFLLVVMVLGIAWSTYTLMTGGSEIRAAFPKAPQWVFPVSGVLGLIQLVCVAGIFLWQKWGFWGICILSVIGYGLNIFMGMGAGQALIGFIGVVVLFVALQIGGDKKGWAQLE